MVSREASNLDETWRLFDLAMLPETSGRWIKG